MTISEGGKREPGAVHKNKHPRTDCSKTQPVPEAFYDLDHQNKKTFFLIVKKKSKIIRSGKLRRVLRVFKYKVDAFQILPCQGPEEQILPQSIIISITNDFGKSLTKCSI